MSPRDMPLGIRRDMPAPEYHAIQALSASGLRLLRKSPAHYYGAVLDPARPQQEPTAAMRAGTLMHLCLFEPERVGALAVRPDGLDGRTKDGKAWTAEHAGREIVAAADLATAQAQAAAVRAVPELGALMAHGYGESSAFWQDPATGVLCKCRPDWVSPAGDGVILVDGKTCQDASPEGFGRSVWTYAYHLQAAHYVAGFEAASGQRVHGFVFAAVESAYPHVAAAYMLFDDVLEAARREVRRLAHLYAECKRAGHWPGYTAGINLVNLPKWAQLETAE